MNAGTPPGILPQLRDSAHFGWTSPSGDVESAARLRFRIRRWGRTAPIPREMRGRGRVLADWALQLNSVSRIGVSGQPNSTTIGVCPAHFVLVVARKAGLAAPIRARSVQRPA